MRNGCDLRRRGDAITCMSGRMPGTVDVDKRVTLEGGGVDINRVPSVAKNHYNTLSAKKVT